MTEKEIRKEIAVRRIHMLIEEFLDEYEGIVGCVYPTDEESFYVASNVQEKLHNVELLDGSLFATDSMETPHELGFPADTFTYDADEYQRRCDEFNASAGQDERPAFPSKFGCRILEGDE